MEFRSVRRIFAAWTVGLLLTFAFPSAAQADPYLKWYRTSEQARFYCDVAAFQAGYSACQPGGFFSYWVYDVHNGARYTFVPCSPGWHVSPYDGFETDLGSLRPVCTLELPDFVVNQILPVDGNISDPEGLLIDVVVENFGDISGTTGGLWVYVTNEPEVSSAALPSRKEGSVVLEEGESRIFSILLDSYADVDLTLPVFVHAVVNPGSYFKHLRGEPVTSEKSYPENAATIEVEGLALPDLVTTFVAFPEEEVYPNQTITFDFDVRNIGEGDIERDISVGAYLSSDGVLDETDLLLGNTVLEGLSAGEDLVSSIDVQIPDGTFSGANSVILVANDSDVFLHQSGGSPEFPETDYDNNGALANLTVATSKPEIEVCVGNPISTNSGRKVEREVDYFGSGSFPLAFSRYYSSSPSNLTGWSFSYSRHLLIVEGAVTDVVLVMDNGSRLEFTDVDNRGYSDPDVPGIITRTTDGFAYLDEIGTIHEFSAQGYLTRIINRDGFTQTLSFVGTHLISIADHFGRTLELTHDDGRVASMTTPDGNVYRYEYDTAGLLSDVVLPDPTPMDDNDNFRRRYLYESATLTHGLTGIIDERGNRFATFDYDDQGRAILSTHDSGAGMNSIAYMNGSTTVTGPLGKETTYVFEEILGSQRLVRVDGHASTNCQATQTTKTYDSRGFVTQEVDANGNSTRYTYTHTGLPEDEYFRHVGLVTSETESVGTLEERTTTIEWHAEFRLPVRIEIPGQVVELEWNGNGQLVRRTLRALDSGDERTWRYTYDPRGLLAQVDGPRADADDVTLFAYDANGALAVVTNALGHATRVLETDASDRPRIVEDPNGVRTHLEYDEQDRLAKMSSQFNGGLAMTTVGYDAAGNVATIHLPDGQTLQYEYDRADRLVEIENDNGETVKYTLDQDGNRTTAVTSSAEGALVRIQRQAFDELSRVIETVDAANQASRLGYDLNGNVNIAEDALGRQTTMDFDGLDRLISMTDALGGRTALTYDARDNLTAVTDAEGVMTIYEYDGLDNLVREVSTASGVTRHEYDAAGNRILTVDANQVVTEYSYDALNRLASTTYLSNPSEDIQYHFDEGVSAVGRLTGVDDASGTTKLHYDDRGNLTRDERVIGGVSYVTRYQYNVAGDLTSVIYPSGRVVDYELDRLARVSAITTRETAAAPRKVVVDDLSYLPYGPARQWRHGNRIASRIDYDEDYRVSAIEIGGLEAVMSVSYQYDDVSNITDILDNLGVHSQSFQYDDLNRLTSAAGNYGTIDYEYDGVGNRRSRTIANGNNTHDEKYAYESGSHRLLSVTSSDAAGTSIRRFEYDANGNTTDDVSPERALTLEVNSRNRLASVRKDGEQAGVYQYNAFGQRVAKTSRYRGRLHAHFDNSKPQDASSKDKRAKGKGAKQDKAPETNLHTHDDNKPITEDLHFHYDQFGNLIAESDAEGKVVREYIYLGRYRIAMTAASLSTPAVSPSRKTQKLDLYFVHNDHLGTPMKVTDAEQRTVWSMEQTPFGEATLLVQGIVQPMRFPGQYADVESGMSYNYFRDYDPSLGRYVQSDPIGISGGANTFSYSNGDPVSYVDPLGLIVWQGSLHIEVGSAGKRGVGLELRGQSYLTLSACDEEGNMVYQYLELDVTDSDSFGSTIANFSLTIDDGLDEIDSTSFGGASFSLSLLSLNVMGADITRGSLRLGDRRTNFEDASGVYGVVALSYEGYAYTRPESGPYSN